MGGFFYFTRLFHPPSDDNDRLKGRVGFMILKIIGIIFAIFISLLTLAVFTKMKVDVMYTFRDKKQQLIIYIQALFGVFRYRIHIPKNMSSKGLTENNEIRTEEKPLAEDDEEEIMKPLKNVQNHFERTKKLYEVAKKFLKKVDICQLEWKTSIGLNDAAKTGIAGGAAWALKGSVLGIIGAYFTIKTEPLLMITPVYNRTVMETFIRCIFKVRIGHAILAGIKILSILRKNKASVPAQTITEQKNEQKG